MFYAREKELHGCIEVNSSTLDELREANQIRVRPQSEKRGMPPEYYIDGEVVEVHTYRLPAYARSGDIIVYDAGVPYIWSQKEFDETYVRRT